MNILDCLKPTWVSHCRLCSASAHWWTLVLTLVHGIAQAGSGPTNGVSEPFFASLSAFSLPSWPLCPGTQISCSLFCSAKDFSDSMHSFTSFDETVSLFIAFRAAWLSEYIWIRLLLHLRSDWNTEVFFYGSSTAGMSVSIFHWLHLQVDLEPLCDRFVDYMLFSIVS